MATGKQTVEVVRGWSGGPYGSREPEDRFDYDVEDDPEKLVELGLVKKVTAKASEAKA
jgi:hypothetical protein